MTGAPSPLPADQGAGWADAERGPDVKLNVGSGSFPVEGFVNIDCNPATAPVVDLYVDPRRPLPFRDGVFEAVYCGHVLEHLLLEAVPAYLADLRRVLAPGGQICVVGPDIERAREGGYPDDIVHACYGEPSRDDGTGEWHLWSCTEQAVAGLLGQSFIDVTPIDIRYLPSEWPTISRAWWQCAVTARKAAA